MSFFPPQLILKKQVLSFFIRAKEMLKLVWRLLKCEVIIQVYWAVLNLLDWTCLLESEELEYVLTQQCKSCYAFGGKHPLSDINTLLAAYLPASCCCVCEENSICSDPLRNWLSRSVYRVLIYLFCSFFLLIGKIKELMTNAVIKKLDFQRPSL